MMRTFPSLPGLRGSRKTARERPCGLRAGTQPVTRLEISQTLCRHRCPPATRWPHGEHPMHACTAPVNEAPLSPIRAGMCGQTSNLRSSSAWGAANICGVPRDARTVQASRAAPHAAAAHSTSDCPRLPSQRRPTDHGSFLRLPLRWLWWPWRAVRECYFQPINLRERPPRGAELMLGFLPFQKLLKQSRLVLGTEV